MGPALGGLLLAVTSIELVFAINALTFLWSAALVVGIRVTEARAEHHERAGFVTELTAGIGAIAHDPDVRAVSLLYTVQTLVAGAMNVLVVLVALELLDTGEAGVGYLNAAIGIGGIVGGFVALVLATRGKLAGDFALGLVLFGLPLAVLGIVTSVPVAILMLGVVGVGNSIVDVGAITLLQRLVADDVLGRVLGTLEGMLIGAIGIGALVAPFLPTRRHRDALIVTGLLLPIARAAATTPLGRIAGRTPRRTSSCSAGSRSSRHFPSDAGGARRSLIGTAARRDDHHPPGRDRRPVLRDRRGRGRGRRSYAPRGRGVRRDRAAAGRSEDGHGHRRHRRRR